MFSITIKLYIEQRETSLPINCVKYIEVTIVGNFA